MALLAGEERSAGAGPRLLACTACVRRGSLDQWPIAAARARVFHVGALVYVQSHARSHRNATDAADGASRELSDRGQSMRGAARSRAVVVGAGVFGAWTAEHLRRAGWRVLLVDRMGAANALASSPSAKRNIARPGWGYLP